MTRSVRVAIFASLIAWSGFCHADPPSARLVGTLWYVSALDTQRSAEDWRVDLDRIQALGMDLMVISGSFVDQPTPADSTGAHAQPMEGFFDETDRRGMRIFINTLLLPNWWTQKDGEPEIARAERTIRNITREYGARSSFAGWYVPYELYVFWDGQADLIRTLYREVSQRCKASANKPVMISPFFILDKAQNLGAFRWAEPEEYQAFWTGILKDSSIDIVALQDSGEHLSYYTMEDRRPFFAAMKGACDAAGKTFWANIETAELDVRSSEDYVTRFGKGTHVNDAKTTAHWRGVPAKKLGQKLQFAGEFTTTAITWGYQEFIHPESKLEANALYMSYLGLELAQPKD